MKYCPYCHRWNLGKPQLCNYCARSWHVRLCPRGHENPYDAQFCGTCGSGDLTETSGPRPWWSRIIQGVFTSLLLFFLFSIVYGLLRSPVADSFLISICFLVFTLYLAVSMLPKPIKGIFQEINKSIKNAFLKVIVWIWELIKEVFA